MKINLSGYTNTKNSTNTKSQSSIFSLIKKETEVQQSSTQDNPFGGAPVDRNMPGFNNNILSEESQTVNSLLSDDNVPLDFKRKNWWVFSRDTTLTFLDEKRKKDKLLNFDIIRIDTLNSLPYYDYDFEVEKEFSILRNAYETKLDRALGTDKANQLNERIAQKSQFNETRTISKDESSSGNGGFISKLLNRR